MKWIDPKVVSPQEGIDYIILVRYKGNVYALYGVLEDKEDGYHYSMQGCCPGYRTIPKQDLIAYAQTFDEKDIRRKFDISKNIEVSIQYCPEYLW